MKYSLTTALLACALATSCTPYVPTPTKASGVRGNHTRDSYETAVLRSDLADGGAYRAWNEAGRRALRDRLGIKPSFREVLHFPADRPTAVGYRLELRRGQQVTITLERRRDAAVFAEVFEEIGPGEPVFRLVHSANGRATRFSYEARTDGPHVLRLQPQLFETGEVAVTVATAAALTFPVTGRTRRAIRSVFGDPRDGGRRSHEGIDIFAPAGTHVVAVAPGIITNVSITPLGGKVVWQHDPARGVDYYYAHLSTQHVRRGDRVQAGELIGTVGNTGNARTTPPHLHFSVYRPGRAAIDPVPFIYDQPSDIIFPVLADLKVLGELRAPRASRVSMRREPTADAANVTTLGPAHDVRIIGGVRDWYRVQLDDGRAGFVRAGDLGGAWSGKASH